MFDNIDILEELSYLFGVFLSVVLGFSIGFERKLRFKEAGIRTHTIVCAGSALMMVVSKYGFGDMGEYDGSRVAAQIVSGIGFIGAGMIIYRKEAVHGLTTAAGVWATAGVGMAAGGGLYIVASGATIVLIVIQCVFHLKCKIFTTKTYIRLKICFEIDNEDKTEMVAELFGAKRFDRISLQRGDCYMICNGTLITEKNITTKLINKIMMENSFIRNIERCDE